MQAGAEGGEADQHAGFDSAVSHTFVIEDRQRARSRVAVALDVVGHFFGREAELLCDAYARSDHEGRRMIQLFAQLSIMDGEGMPSAKFES